MAALHSTAVCSKMAAVGAQLEKNQNQILEANIFSWIKENPQIKAKLWLAMETEIIFELMKDSTEKHLPQTCTRVGLLSATVQKHMVQRGMPMPFGRPLLALMRGKDPKIIDKLMTFKYQWLSKYPLKAAMSYSDLFKLSDARAEVLGNREGYIEIEDDGTILWPKCGVYGFGFSRESRWHIILDNEEFEAKATHVVHKPTGIGLELKALGFSKITKEFTFIDNHDETIARVSNGRRISCDLWPDLQGNDKFKYEDLMSGKFGSDGWKELAGGQVGQARNTAKEEIKKKEDEVKELRKRAKSNGVAPGKKRRALR